MIDDDDDIPIGSTHDQYCIGTEFRCSGKTYRCTDVGSRTIVAIRIDQVEVTTFNTKADETTQRVLSREEAEEIGWFNGPPYGVVERVFDEDDLNICDIL